MMADFEVNDVGTEEKIRELAAENAMLSTRLSSSQAAGRTIADRYNELLLAVETKTEGESRHDTALRYIRQSESANDEVRALGDDVGEKYPT